MLKIQKVTHTFPHHWQIDVTSRIGMTIEKTRDGANASGISFFFWYPKGRARHGYASAWLPLPFVNFK
jgi:hypothetical protein